MGKTFNRGLDEDDQEEGFFKRLKNIENAQKNIISDNDNKNIYYKPRPELDSKDDKDKDKKNNKTTT